MALVVCRLCRRAFTNAQNEEVCPDCAARLNKLYPIVRNFLRNHENESYTAYEVSRLIGVDVKDVEGLVSMDLIRSGTPAYAHDTEMNSKKRETEKEIKKEKEMEKEIEKEIEKEKTPLTKRKNFNSVYLSHKKKP